MIVEAKRKREKKKFEVFSFYVGGDNVFLYRVLKSLSIKRWEK